MTSYFAAPGIAADPRAVSIARYPPRWWGKRRRCIDLAPSVGLLREAKAGLPWHLYVKEYRREVLARLTPSDIFTNYHAAILLCWEAPEPSIHFYCHRRLVASWIETALGVHVPEVSAGVMPAPLPLD